MYVTFLENRKSVYCFLSLTISSIHLCHNSDNQNHPQIIAATGTLSIIPAIEDIYPIAYKRHKYVHFSLVFNRYFDR